MKRLFSILLSSLILTTSAWAVTVEDINSYASKLAFSENSKSGNVNANRQVEVEFYTMASTSKWWVYMDVNQDGVYEESEIIARNENAQITKNNVTTTVVCTIPNTVPAGEYTWAVKVQGEDRSDWSAPKVARNYANTDHRYEFSRAMGVTYIYSYESNRFGYSYVTETFQNKKAWTGGRKTTDGIYGFGPAMGESYNKDANSNLVNYGAYTGGLTWSTADHNNYYKESSPFRLSTDKEGYVYVCDAVPSSSRTGRVFRMDPSSPKSNFVTVLTTTHLSQNGLPTHLQAATVGYDKSGNKVLYAILGTVNTDGTIANNVCICEFNINDLNNITYKRQKSLYQFTQSGQSQKLTIINAYNTIVAGEYGDLWIFQSRGGSNAAQPSAVHLNADWTCDYIIPSSSELNRRGSGALTKDGKILAMPTGSAIIKFYDITYSNTSNGSISKLTEKKYSLTVPQIDSKVPYVDAMVFDVANNLYIAANIGAGYSESQGRLYVYALPKADNSHITPARSSLKIRVSEGLTWHPYPDGYNVTNADLLEMFNADRANWNGTLTDFMTSSTSKWKWLGNYIAEITNANAKLPDDMNTNDKLWGSYDPNKAPWDGFKKYFNDYHNVSRSNMEIGECATFCYITNAATTREKVYDILTNGNSNYKWLGDYILEIAKEQKITVSQDESQWNWILHGFFNKDDKTSKTKSGTLTHGFNFTEAGKPENWSRAYFKSLGTYIALKTDADWQKQLDDFFKATGDYTSAGQSDQAHNGANGWYNEWWNANFPSVMVNAVAFPTVKRVGHVQNGWYYGGSEGYESAAREMSGAVQHSGHIWARWLEVGLYEGYLSINNSNVTEFSSEEKAIKEVNRNIELINLLSGQEVAIKIDRKLVGGMYNTMCLPFDIAGKEAFSQIVYADGTGSPFAKVGGEYPFSLVKYVGTQAGENELILDFDELGAADPLPANTPFLLKPNADITKPLKYNAARISGGGAQPASDEDDNEEVNNTLGQNYGITVGDGDEYFTYTGVLAPTTIPDGSVLLVADNRLAQSTGGEMKGMRGFFTAKIQPLEMPAVVRITSRDGVTTYLDAINMTTESKTATKVLHNGQIYILRGDEIYTLTGARVK